MKGPGRHIGLSRGLDPSAAGPRGAMHAPPFMRNQEGASLERSGHRD